MRFRKVIPAYALFFALTISCDTGKETEKEFGETGISDNAVDYELKAYDDTAMVETDSPAIGYDQPAARMKPKTAVRDNVKYILEKDPLLNRYNIDIEVFRDTLLLRGEVYSFEEKQKIEELLSGLEDLGVIKNEIIVKNMISSPYQHPYQYYAYPRMSTPELEPDEKIKEQIENELKWSVFVNADNIEVTVNNGQVTLTGTVDTKTEKKYAEKNAVEGGAFTVQNHLVVEHKP